jgi:hypothetical protein
MMKKLAAVLATLPLIFGCATFPDYKGPDAACISGAMANPIRGITSGDAHVAVDAIDGVAGWGGGTYCVTPGRHRVTYRALERSLAADGTIDLQMDAGRRYSLRARIVGSAATVQQVDISEKEPRIVAQFETQSSDSGIRPAVIMIPVR